VPEYLGLLSIAADSPTGFVVQKTLSLELQELMPKGSWPAFEKQHFLALNALRTTRPAGERPIVEKLHAGMQKAREVHLSTGKEPGFASTLDFLGDMSAYASGNEDRCGEGLFSNRHALIGKVARELAWRLVEIEEAADAASEAGAAPDVKLVGPLIAGATQLATETYFNGLEYNHRLRWSPSSMPSEAGFWGKLWDTVAPYYLTGDLAHGGLELGYLPTLHLWGSGSGLTAPLAPLSWSRQFDTLGARAGLSYALSGRFRSFSRLEVGPYFSIDYTKHPEGWVGAEVALQLLYNHLRLSFNVDFFEAIQPGGSAPSEDRLRLGIAGLRLGLADLNGVLYWIGRAL
jgi:hypothetical protein